MDIDLNKMAKLNNDGFKQCFFYVCEREDILSIKKMFIKLDIKSRLDSEMLCAGLFAGILADKPKSISAVLDIASRLGVILKNQNLEPVFNLLIKKEDDVLIKYLDNKFNFLKNQFNKDGYLSLHDNKYFYEGSCGGIVEPPEPSPVEKFMSNYTGNVLSKSLLNENHLIYLLKQDLSINPTFVEELFLNTCMNKAINIAKILLTNQQIKIVIKNSEDLNGYMNEPTENKKFKDEIKDIINAIELEEKLDYNLSKKQFNVNKIKL